MKTLTGYLKGYAILALLAMPGLASAASESEVNNPIGMANTLTISDEGSAAVDGTIGALSGTVVPKDLDFFTFWGKAGDVVTLDIDGGIGGKKNVDTILAVFGPGPGYQVLRWHDDVTVGLPLDLGSTSRLDAIIKEFTLPATGTYIVGVSAYPYDFVTGGSVECRLLRGVCPATSNGDYTLLITGVSLPLLPISIDIKPGSGERAPINPKSRGKIPVALIGASDFTVHDVNADKLTFGHSGDEASYVKCGEPADVNGDAFPDLVCHFENQDAKFADTDSEAILRGELNDGTRFEGRGYLKVVPVKAQE